MEKTKRLFKGYFTCIRLVFFMPADRTIGMMVVSILLAFRASREKMDVFERGAVLLRWISLGDVERWAWQGKGAAASGAKRPTRDLF